MPHGRKPTPPDRHLHPRCPDDLDRIWDDNAGRYDADHAEAYVRFLRDRADGLATDQGDGKPIVGFPELRRTIFRRRPRGDGHIAIYQVDPEAGTVNVLHFYHTKMDVEGRLRRERG